MEKITLKTIEKKKLLCEMRNEFSALVERGENQTRA